MFHRSLLFFASICVVLASDDKKMYINSLIEKDNAFFRLFTNEQVFGELYITFKTDENLIKNKFIGQVTRKGKNGNWKIWWNNGAKKASGYYSNSKKEGLWVEWAKDGRKFSKAYYEKGKIVHLINCFIEDCK